MAVTHYTEWTIERGEDSFDICIDYEFRDGDPGVYSGPPEHCYPGEAGEATITSVWRKSDEHLTDAPEFELTDAERGKIELWLLENPPEPDYPEDF